MAVSDYPPARGRRAGFAAAFGLGIVPVIVLIALHGQAPALGQGLRGSDEGPPRSVSPPLAASAPLVAESAGAMTPSRSPTHSLAPRPATPEEHFRQLEVLRRTDPDAALGWAERGQEWFGTTGRLAEAREATRITLLVELGRMSDARRLTYAFLEAHPASEYRRLVQGVTGIHPRPGAPPEIASR